MIFIEQSMAVANTELTDDNICMYMLELHLKIQETWIGKSAGQVANERHLTQTDDNNTQKQTTTSHKQQQDQQVTWPNLW